MGDVTPFNPLDKKNLAESVAGALLESEPIALRDLRRFEGSGVYALYYTGSFYAYDPLAKANKLALLAPIYVGKADSKGKRKGGFAESSASGTALYSRLSDHAKSLVQAENLSVDDFWCKYLVVDDLWISLGESLLISRFVPVWNTVVEGFGNHDPGKGRRAGARPLWDTLHPGRPWAAKLPANSMAPEVIGADALQYLFERMEAVSLLGGELGYDVVEL